MRRALVAFFVCFVAVVSSACSTPPLGVRLVSGRPFPLAPPVDPSTGDAELDSVSAENGFGRVVSLIASGCSNLAPELKRPCRDFLINLIRSCRDPNIPGVFCPGP